MKFKSSLINVKKSCPLDKDELGSNSWSLLHTMAAYYPEKASKSEEKDMIQFISLFSKFYPCPECALEMQKDIKLDPPKADSKKSFSTWLCNLHNKVNTRLNKPLFDCNKLDERWLTGPEDGSCDPT
jgi:FAD-linked sulfhydryl oxidase ALR